jgi:hypothetical protein
MASFDLSLIDLPRVQPFTALEVYPLAAARCHLGAETGSAHWPSRATTLYVDPLTDTMTFEEWVAAGKPCTRTSCGHCHCDHIPSEAMACDSCDCLGFVGFAPPGDAAVGSSLTAPTFVNNLTSLATGPTGTRPTVVTRDADPDRSAMSAVRARAERRE